jgi:hypothetical protein
MELAERHSSPSPRAADAAGTRLQWSRWSRCESSFSLLLVPDRPGIFAVSEEVLASAAAGKRMLALLLFSETHDLARDLNRLFTPASPIYERIATGRCFVRYALVDDADERRAAASALKEWLLESAELASGIPVDAAPAVAEVEKKQTALVSPASEANSRELKPAPFPAGF